MDILEAKQLLSAYQSDREHFSDPHMLEALGMLEHHEELAVWFERQLAFDRQVRSALDDAPEPAGLKRAILADFLTSKRGKVIRTIRRVFAAAVLLLLGVAGFWGSAANYNSKMHDYATLREGMSHFIARSYFTLDFLTKDMGKIEDWLREKHAPVHEIIPAALLEKEPIGCKKMSWQGREVSLICFHREDGKVIHLFVADRNSLGEAAIANLDQVVVSHGLETGGWVTDSHVYLLACSEPGVTVLEYLG